MHLVHVNGGTSDIASKGGIANIYNDAGTTYAYRTTKVWAEAFRGNTDVRIVRFSDYRYTNMHAPFRILMTLMLSPFITVANMKLSVMVISLSISYSSCVRFRGNKFP